MPSEYILGLIQRKWKYYKFYRQSKFTIPERHRQIKKKQINYQGTTNNTITLTNIIVPS
jgi:phage protein U